MKQLDWTKEIAAHEEVVTKCLERWAEESGDKTFLYYGETEKHISYRQFNEWANSIGHTLQARGISKGDRVSVFLKNPLITTLAMFGIWKCGVYSFP